MLSYTKFSLFDACWQEVQDKRPKDPE